MYRRRGAFAAPGRRTLPSRYGHQGHHDHRGRPDGDLRPLLRRNAPRHGADRRRAPGAWRPTDGAVSGEVHLRRRGLPQGARQGSRQVARRAGAPVRAADPPEPSRRRARGRERTLRAGDRQGSLSHTIDRHRGGHRRVLTTAAAAGLRAALVRPRDLRRRHRSGGVPRQARDHHRRRRLRVRLGYAAARSRHARDDRPPQRPVPRARRNRRAVSSRGRQRQRPDCSRFTSCTTSGARTVPTRSRTSICAT